MKEKREYFILFLMIIIIFVQIGCAVFSGNPELVEAYRKEVDTFVSEEMKRTINGEDNAFPLYDNFLDLINHNNHRSRFVSLDDYLRTTKIEEFTLNDGYYHQRTYFEDNIVSDNINLQLFTNQQAIDWILSNEFIIEALLEQKEKTGFEVPYDRTVGYHKQPGIDFLQLDDFMDYTKAYIHYCLFKGWYDKGIDIIEMLFIQLKTAGYRSYKYRYSQNYYIPQYHLLGVVGNIIADDRISVQQLERLKNMFPLFYTEDISSYVLEYSRIYEFYKLFYYKPPVIQKYDPNQLHFIFQAYDKLKKEMEQILTIDSMKERSDAYFAFVKKIGNPLDDFSSKEYEKELLAADQAGDERYEVLGKKMAPMYFSSFDGGSFMSWHVNIKIDLLRALLDLRLNRVAITDIPNYDFSHIPFIVLTIPELAVGIDENRGWVSAYYKNSENNIFMEDTGFMLEMFESKW